MDKCIALSKEFKTTNKSRESINKLYGFINRLRDVSNNKQVQMVAYIYAIFKCRQNAYKALIIWMNHGIMK